MRLGRKGGRKEGREEDRSRKKERSPYLKFKDKITHLQRQGMQNNNEEHLVRQVLKFVIFQDSVADGLVHLHIVPFNF